MAISCSHTFSLESHNCQVLPLVKRGLLPHVLKSIHKIHLHSTQLYGVLKKQQRREWIIQISQKEKLFQSHKKLSAIWGNLILHHPSLPLPKNTFQFGQVENINGYLFEKIFLICFIPLYPQAEQKEDDEHFANHLQMYVSRTFPKPKKSVICAEYPMSSKFHLSKWKTYFSQFIDKFLKIEEVEYLIHYVKFKM